MCLGRGRLEGQGEGRGAPHTATGGRGIFHPPLQAAGWRAAPSRRRRRPLRQAVPPARPCTTRRALGAPGTRDGGHSQDAGGGGASQEGRRKGRTRRPCARASCTAGGCLGPLRLAFPCPLPPPPNLRLPFSHTHAPGTTAAAARRAPERVYSAAPPAKAVEDLVRHSHPQAARVL